MPFEIANKETVMVSFQNLPPHHNYVVWLDNGNPDRHGEWAVASGSSFDEAVALFEVYIDIISSTQNWVEESETRRAAQADITRWKVQRLEHLELLVRKFLADGQDEELRKFLS